MDKEARRRQVQEAAQRVTIASQHMDDPRRTGEVHREVNSRAISIQDPGHLRVITQVSMEDMTTDTMEHNRLKTNLGLL